MNYSDYDSDGYSSNEDADYVPSDDNLSEDDINECEKEDPLHENDDVPHPDGVTKKKKTKTDISVRKRKKGVLKVEKEEGKAEDEEESRQQQEEEEPSERDDEERQKKKADDLWASFLSDVGSRPKDTAQKTDSSVSKASPLTTQIQRKPAEPAKVTITKVFDFAGEEVRMNKEVSSDSREAKSFLKSQIHQQKEDEEHSTHSPRPLPGPSKRPVGVSGVLSHIGGKKQKMSTLEKSKMDWDAFKTEEGISEELAIHNRGRDGYVERKNFLERVDHRQFELEKSVRLSNMKQ
ncbi:craniofacial development protein 1 isoform X2 [Sphaeramia orbicularis]|uniref:Craniofacial development protein 1 n=1 Tax=Sphaeramia orbicularis TaxID=375764 RepID=A0A673C0H1_9TELE|nr:craniofacial development protein 1 isoform X2 [Sphaeramia orbicularis]